MKTLLEIAKNKYLISVAILLGTLFGLSFVVPDTIRDLFRYFAYVSICSNLIPLPSTPAILLMGKEFDLLPSAMLTSSFVFNPNPLLVAFLLAVATCLANMLDYEILGTILRSRLLRRIRESKHYESGVDYFNRVGFPLLTFVNFAWFTFDFFRLLAIAAGYAKWKYILSTFIGRFGRYLIMAYMGKLLNIPIWAVILITLILIAPSGIGYIRFRKRKESLGRVCNGRTDDDTGAIEEND